jgi:hypothetical protein
LTIIDDAGIDDAGIDDAGIDDAGIDDTGGASRERGCMMQPLFD